MYYDDSPEILLNYLDYLDSVKGRSQRTISEYFFEVRMFLRFVKCSRGIVINTDFDDISIKDVNVSFLSTIQLKDAVEYLTFSKAENGRKASSRARSVAAIRSFFAYLSDVAMVISNNPMKNLNYPTIHKKTPAFLSVEESERLLLSVKEQRNFQERNYCILMLFLSCGLRVSELCALDLSDISEDRLTVHGKGNKERTIFLNDVCIQAINDYLPHRISCKDPNETPLFTSRQRNRMHKTSVEIMVKQTLRLAGLDDKKYSTHKLRHSAATMMYRNGVDVLTLQNILGHENLNTTTIYTHIFDEDKKRAMDNHPLANFNKNKEE